MKKHILFFAISALILGLSSCGGEKKTTEDTTQPEKSCFYSYNAGSTVLEWTAFKFTEKTGVKGTFNKITIEGMEKSDDPKKMVESLNFSIETASVETQNEERNGKIAKLFFGTIATPIINGKVKSLSDNGKATIEIEMNKMKKDVVGKYTLEDGMFNFTATIDVMTWNAGNGIKELNTACKDLHTGADGKSKLWSEIDLSFTTELMSDCD
jgi:polyisoprenoid-binding protein YceI